MKKLVIMCAPPGAGKSTFAKTNYPRYVYINQDEQGKQHLEMFHKALIEGKDIVVDRMNFNKVQRNRYLNPAKELGYHIEIVVLHESYDKCLQRCFDRKNHPTIQTVEEAKSALNTFFTKYERVEDGEADKITRIWLKDHFHIKPPAIWIDMDNTLSSADHREHHLQGEKKNWKAFFDEMDKDPINEWCGEIIRRFSSGFDGDPFITRTMVLICSARPDDYRKKTIDWLNKNNVIYDDLLMRRKGDYRKDSLVKEIMYEFEVKTKYDLLFCIDDRKDVIDKIRSHGVIVLDCAGEKGHF